MTLILFENMSVESIYCTDRCFVSMNSHKQKFFEFLLFISSKYQIQLFCQGTLVKPGFFLTLFRDKLPSANFGGFATFILKSRNFFFKSHIYYLSEVCVTVNQFLILAKRFTQFN